ncbi:MAG TPA: hypothetical protein VK716_01650 [Terracidiphilus sp.]|jgi:ABC-2 type transport system permease protein|nr:hypothetical protein [Terracidiphilus sp.]
MADLASQRPDNSLPLSSGPFGKFARGQYAALIRMRARMIVNGLRSNQGVFEFSARAIAYGVYALIGLTMAVGAGGAAFSLVFNGEWRFFPIEFWILFFIWQSIAVALASFQEQYDLGSLLRFPVNFGSYYALFLIFGFVDITTVIGGLCCCGILAGVTLARLDLFLWTAPILVAFALFNILLARAVLAWIDRWLAKRRSRELISVLFVLALLSLQLLNPALHAHGDHGLGHHRSSPADPSQFMNRIEPWLGEANAIQRWLPPGLISRSLTAAGSRELSGALEPMGILSLYVLAAGAILGIRLRAEYRGESFGEAPERDQGKAKTAHWLLAGGPVAAIIEKDLRTMSRSIPQLYSLAIPMLMVIVVGGLFGNSRMVHRPQQFALPLCVAYGLLGFTQLVYNALGPEGTGIQLLFFAPVKIRSVLLAKNLLHSALYLFVAIGSGFLACLRMGWPSPTVLITTFAWLLFALPANLAAGDLLSITMAYRVNLGRLGRQSGSQGNAILSMLIQTLLIGVGAGVIGVCAYMKKPWAATPALLVFAVAAVFAWLHVLGKSDEMANARRDTLISRLARAE